MNHKLKTRKRDPELTLIAKMIARQKLRHPEQKLSTIIRHFRHLPRYRSRFGIQGNTELDRRIDNVIRFKIKQFNCRASRT